MTLFTLCATLGLLFPPLIAVVQQSHWTTGTRSFVTGALAALGALAIVIGHGDWHGWTLATWDAYSTAFAALAGFTVLSYLGGWRNWPITRWIEQRTTVTRDPLTRVLAIGGRLTPAQRAQVLAAWQPPAPPPQQTT